jgi:hypothetical protein
VDKGSELQLKTDYNRTHPPLDTRGLPASFDDDTIDEEEEVGHNDPGNDYNAFNTNTYPGNTTTFPSSSSVPSSHGALFAASKYQQGGSYQGRTFQQSGMHTWTHGQDPYQMSRSTSQPGYYGTAGSSGNMYYPGSQQPLVQSQQWSHQNYPSASGDSVPVGPEDYEGDRHRRGSTHSSEQHSSYDPGEAQKALVEEEELEEETETETESHHQPHYDPAPEGDHHGAQDYHEDIYDP